MDVGRRYNQHEEGRTSSMARMMSFFVVIFLMITTVSSMLFRSRPFQDGTNNCLPGMDPTTLRDVTSGLSNRSNIFDHLLPNLLIVRVSGTQGNVFVREFIKREMESLGWLVEEDKFHDQTPYGLVEFSNVIATFNPSARKRLVVACHYDSKYLPYSQPPFVAATDSAVPCSIMMDTAKQLNQVAQDAGTSGLSDFSLQFIFFDGEEAFVRWSATDSLYGSRHLASLWENSADRNDPTAANNLQNIVSFTLLDLIGTHDTRFVNYYADTSHLFHRLVSIEQCLVNQNLMTRPYRRTIFDPYDRPHSIVQDDHVPFHDRGVSVVHLISTPFPSVWHTAYDNLNYLDQDLIDDFSRIFRVYLTSLLVGI